MGQKVNPIGFRVGIIRDWESRWYAGKDFAELLLEDAKIRKYVKKSLYAAGISRTEIERSANKVKITIHTAKPGIIIGRGGKGVDDLRADIEKLSGGKMVHVNVQEIRNPETDAQLVAESIAQQVEKRISYKTRNETVHLPNHANGRQGNSGARGRKTRRLGNGPS